MNYQCISSIRYGVSLLLIGIFLVNCSPQKDDGPRKIEILFLGHDQEHHNSEKYLPLLASALSPKGINFSYTDEVNDLNSKNLEQYDGLLLYANHDSISPSQEKALLDFVRKGKGFIPVHCASYCFRNSDEFVKLVGAQFKEHGTGTFAANIVVGDHPITEGMSIFETWDETYVHDFHNEDRLVLMERQDGDHNEPWTWVRNYGKGRVFYTAYGHDERTWDNPGFHLLMERGIRWAVGDILSQNLDKITFPTLAYSEAKIPNYEKRDPPPQLQTPLDPESSQKLIQIPPGFELQLFASEPDISAPISGNWDEKGRLWLLETKDYPNEINIENGIGNDKITILEDTDQDGKADKFTTFADNLSVPTSLVFHDGGVIVSQAPHFLFLKDTDGDDKADVREIIMTGWGTYDTHAGPSNLRYGFDNMYWGTVGYSAFNGKVGLDSLKFGQGVYRFQPDGLKMEYVGATSNNTWGLGFSETFDIFVSTANNTHSAYLGIPNQITAGVLGITDQAVKKIEGHYAFHPITKNFRQVDVFGGFTAAAGHSLYTARDFPKEYWNRIAFVCEPTGHLLHRAILEKDGAGFKEKDGWNILASADEWVSPVQAEVGPDGALWIMDWYNFIIQHNPTPSGFENGPGNAHINPLRDKVHGRIYRLVHKDAKPYKPIQLTKEQPKELLAQLKNDNLFWRLHAQRLLVERGNQDVVPDLVNLLKDQSVDAIGLNSPAVHAIWTLHGLNAFSEEGVIENVRNALNHPAAGVRKAALQTLPKDQPSLEAMIVANLLNDNDLNIQLEALLFLCQAPSTEAVGNLLYDLNKEERMLQDELLAKALYIANVKHSNAFIQVLYEKEPALLAPENLKAKPVNWLAQDLDLSDWEAIPVPSTWQNTKLPELDRLDGVVWYRKELDIKSGTSRQRGTLSLGYIHDSDQTYVNGKKVGGFTNQSDKKRIYSIPANLLKTGKNVIAVRVEDKVWRGGIIGEPEEVYLQLGSEKIPLTEGWKYKIEEVYRREKSAFHKGGSPLEFFLQNYGPYAEQLAGNITSQDESVRIDQTIQIKTVPDQMKYDVTSFTVQAGSTIEIVLENTDAMQHNMLILEPGSLEKVGAAADKMAQSANGPARGYIPQLSYVLAYTSLLNPGEIAKIQFQVPSEPGDYPFVCTFPGHWRTMNGVLKVRGSDTTQ